MVMILVKIDYDSFFYPDSLYMQCHFHSVSVIIRILQFYNHRPVSTTNLLQLIMASDVNNL